METFTSLVAVCSALGFIIFWAGGRYAAWKDRAKSAELVAKSERNLLDRFPEAVRQTSTRMALARAFVRGLRADLAARHSESVPSGFRLADADRTAEEPSDGGGASGTGSVPPRVD